MVSVYPRLYTTDPRRPKKLSATKPGTSIVAHPFQQQWLCALVCLYLVLGNGGLIRLNHRFQLPNFLPQSCHQRVNVGVVDGHGVHDLLRTLNVPVVRCGTVRCRAVDRLYWGWALKTRIDTGEIRRRGQVNSTRENKFNARRTN